MNKNTRKAVLICLYILLGGGIGFLAQQHAKAERSQSIVPVTPTPQMFADVDSPPSDPVQVILPEVGIDVPIQIGVYDEVKRTWNISDRSAYFASVTAMPNAISGTTLVYAHNIKNLFGPTDQIQPGDTAVVITANGTHYTYAYTGENVVSPTETQVFDSPRDGPPQLIILTCGGSWNEKRRLLYFQLSHPTV